MFSQTAEYALRAVVMLAHLESDGPVGSSVLAVKSQVPPSYLAKILQALVRAGIVYSKRGVGGGFTMVKEPDELTVLEVINAVDPIQRIRGCPLGLKSHCRKLCPMHARLDEAMALVETVLGKSTIAELLGDTSRPTPMIETAAFLEDAAG